MHTAISDVPQHIFKLRQQQKDIDAQWKHLQGAMQHSTEQHIPTTEHKPKQPWISNETWELIEQRRTARQAQNEAEEQRLHKAIRKADRKDKVKWLQEQLLHSAKCVSATDKWAWIKRLKKTYTARATALKDLNGKLVNTLKQTETFGEYLEQKHWGSPTQPYTGSRTQMHAHSPVEMGESA